MGIAGLPRLALALVAAVALATAAGLIAVWPGSTDAKLAETLRPPTFGAEVAAVRAADCEFATAERCMTAAAPRRPPRTPDRQLAPVGNDAMRPSSDRRSAVPRPGGGRPGNEPIRVRGLRAARPDAVAACQ